MVCPRVGGQTFRPTGRWRQSDLAEAAGLHPKAVAYWEAKTTISSRGEEVGVGRIRAAFEAAGVSTFVNPSPGVRIIARR